MAFQFDAAGSKQELKEVVARKREDIKFFDLKPDCSVFFYLLPPFSERGRIVRHVQKLWLPELRKTHVLWRTYGPEYAEEDPVLVTLARLETEGKCSVGDFKPRTIAYGNVLVVSEGRTGGRFNQLNPPDLQTIGFPIQIGEQLVGLVIETPEVLDPTQTTPFLFERTGEGLATRYSITLCGQQSPDGFERRIENIVAKYGEAITAAYDRPPDLDKLWVFSDKTRERTEKLAEELESAIRLRSVVQKKD